MLTYAHDLQVLRDQHRCGQTPAGFFAGFDGEVNPLGDPFRPVALVGVHSGDMPGKSNSEGIEDA